MTNVHKFDYNEDICCILNISFTEKKGKIYMTGTTQMLKGYLRETKSYYMHNTKEWLLDTDGYEKIVKLLVTLIDTYYKDEHIITEKDDSIHIKIKSKDKIRLIKNLEQIERSVGF